MLSSAVKDNTILRNTFRGNCFVQGAMDIPDVVTSSLDNVEKEWILRMLEEDRMKYAKLQDL